MTGEIEISIVAPCFNEEECIEEFIRRLSIVLLQLGVTNEIILIDDGSRDNTLNKLNQLSNEYPNLVIISFSRNFGHQPAVTAGLDNAKGKAIVLIDADLQDPPEVIIEMYKKWKTGTDVVYGQRKTRKGESWFKLLTAKLFYKLIQYMTDCDIPMNTGDFRLIDSKVAVHLNSLREKHRFIRGMVSWVGFRQDDVQYDRDPRFAGETKYPFIKMFKFSIDAITSFSILPLRLMIMAGFGTVGISVIWSIVTVIRRLIHPEIFIPGYTATVLLIVFFGGIQLMATGLIGEYIGRIYEEIKKRPLYIIDKIFRSEDKE
ncbi:MAG: glycosyl transferase family 2 [Ignavibacteria bacterium]|nr:glycosyl transferase family 2 [Ignavibacteria bacterium]